MRYALAEIGILGAALALDDTARRAACAAILDLTTAALAAPPLPFTDAIQAAYGTGPCHFWLSGASGSALAAGFHNAMLAARLDLDDGHRRARGHPGAAVIPAVLAEADRLDAVGSGPSDDEILRAIVVGYELGLRIASARGFYARTGYWTGFAAAAGVGALNRLSADKLAHALAIGGETGPQMATTTAGPGWPQPLGSDVKEGIPWGVVHGMAAVALASAGMVGPLDFVDHAPFFDRDAILADRPGPAILEAYTKFYAACRHCHAPVDAFIALQRDNALGVDEIEAIVVGSHNGALRIANRVSPHTLSDAQYSIPYCIGLAATRGPAALLPMLEADLADPAAEAIARKVRVELDAACEVRFPAETPARVVVQARGQRFTSAIVVPRGEATQPPSWDERIEKFRIATAWRTEPAQRPWLRAFSALSEGRLRPLRDLLARVPA